MTSPRTGFEHGEQDLRDGAFFTAYAGPQNLKP
jgi:hypothetical protein